jgi:hypothetical protein
LALLAPVEPIDDGSNPHDMRASHPPPRTPCTPPPHDPQQRVKETERTERSINAARESYRPAATRGSVLYFVVADLAAASPMYQFSLPYFMRLFCQCIERSEKGGNMAARLQALSDYATRLIFKNVSRWARPCATLRLPASSSGGGIASKARLADGGPASVQRPSGP